MSSIATLPRTGGNGAALVVVVADLLMSVYGALTARSEDKGSVPKVAVLKAPVLKAPALEVKAASKAVTAKAADKLDVWQLYRLAGNSDSVNPKVLASLR
jgi:hypothetical protein